MSSSGDGAPPLSAASASANDRDDVDRDRADNVDPDRAAADDDYNVDDVKDRAEHADEQVEKVDDKSYKICSVLGGLDVTRYVSSNTRRFFENAIDDVELIREVVSEAAYNGGIAGGLHNLARMAHTLDYNGRGFPEGTTTIEAGLGYADDRPNRRMDRYVSLSPNRPLVGDKATDMALVDAVSIIFPWIVDRKSNEKSWYVPHENGRSQGPTKEPFVFDRLYSAAWIGTYGEAWAYYPPFTKLSPVEGAPFTVGDVVGSDMGTHDLPFVGVNFPENNPSRHAFFRNPYPDTAQPGVSLITALAPVYLTGTFGNVTYNDTYVASTGLDIAVSAVSSLLDVLRNKLTSRSFAMLVDVEFNTIVVSQEVVEWIYPQRTGFELVRVVYDPSDATKILDDRRNQTYQVSDTIHQPLTELSNGDWKGLRLKVQASKPGERDYDVMNLTLTTTTSTTDAGGVKGTMDGEKEEFYVMYERWKYVADWVLMAFAPVEEVENAIQVGIFRSTSSGTSSSGGNLVHENNNNSNGTITPSSATSLTHSLRRNTEATHLLNETSVALTGERGQHLTGHAVLLNRGTLDVSVVASTQRLPSWFQIAVASSTILNDLPHGNRDNDSDNSKGLSRRTQLPAGSSLPLEFTVDTNRLEIGTSSVLLTFNVRDDDYPDCFYNRDVSLDVTVHVKPMDCVALTGDRWRRPATVDNGGGYGGVGACVCADGAVEMGSLLGGRCVPWALLLPGLLIPFLALSLVTVYVDLERKRRHADSVWAVKTSELKFEDPPEVVGRGTFGLVLLAEYRGTEVAVKRVIPPRKASSSSKAPAAQDQGGGQRRRPRRRSFLGEMMGSTKFRESLRNMFHGNHSGNGAHASSRKGSTDVIFNFDHTASFSRSFKRGSLDTTLGTTTGQRTESQITWNGNKRRSLDSSIGNLDPVDASNLRGEGDVCDGSSTDFLDFNMSMASGNLSGTFATLSVARRGRSFWPPWKKRKRTSRSRYAELKAEFIEEMRHLSKLRHPCITTVMGAVITKNEEPLLVMEYMDHGSLYDLLHNETMVIEGELVLPVLRDVAHGMRFLHAASPPVIHGDLKAQNVLVDAKFRAKVADFGLSQKKHVGATGAGGLMHREAEVAGTPLWMAPELLRGETSNTEASDVFAFGIILYEVYSRKDPYENEDPREVLRGVCDPDTNKRPPVPPSMPGEVKSLMSDCLVADPASRPTFEEIDNRLKRFDVENVEPGAMNLSMQQKVAPTANELRSTNLLFEIFPRHIAEALRNGRKVEPEHHACVTIFFSDIVGFTAIASSLPPSKVADMLRRLYEKMDALSHKHEVFKIETVGDAWMGAANIVSHQPDHTKRVAQFSIDAIRAADETMIDEDNPGMGFVRIRCGFHSGPVLSDVVGSRIPKFAIFGDSVNTASRMESTSLPCRIQCSSRAAKLLRQQCPELPVAYRGETQIKGKGTMRTYWVNEVDFSALRRLSNDSQGYSIQSQNDEMSSSNLPSEDTPLLNVIVTQ